MNPCSQLVLRHYAPILTHRRFHLRRFMSEVLGYVLRKAPLHMTNDCIASVVDILAPQVVESGCSVTDKVCSHTFNGSSLAFSFKHTPESICPIFKK